MKSASLQFSPLRWLVNTLNSDAQLQESSRSETTGPKLTEVLKKSWVDGIWLQGLVARSHRFEIALAASEGLITTKGLDGTYWDRWLITEKGMKWLNKK